MTRTIARHQVRDQIGHPVIDGDGHWLEPVPAFLDFLRDAGGPTAVAQYRALAEERIHSWYAKSREQQLHSRHTRPVFWGEAGPTRDRATAMLPALMHERQAEIGIDLSIIYPSLGLFVSGVKDDALRRAAARAMNQLSAEYFQPYAQSMVPVAVVPAHSPDEAIEEATYAVRELGMKALMIANVRRAVPAYDTGADGSAFYIDSLGLDSSYDYDPFWQTCLDLKVAVTTHGGSMGWPDRSSPTNYVYNHLGHFANANHAICKALFLGGVTYRFPDLHFAFLEGGVGWACSLVLDLVEHWEKRSERPMSDILDPARLDSEELRKYYATYGAQLAERFDEVMATPSVTNPFRSPAELSRMVRETGVDDFAATHVSSTTDIRERFRRSFWFGCEADDRMNAVAFDPKIGANLNAMFSSDISHFDVLDMSTVMDEAYELVEDGLLTEENFKAFTFTNAVSLHMGMNPDFFRGTVVEGFIEPSASLGPKG